MSWWPDKIKVAGGPGTCKDSELVMNQRGRYIEVNLPDVK